MAKRMLIDGTHPEETRVVILEGNRLSEYDFETSTKKQLKGNIYLAKVTRVEPSLQAAFIEFGGDRHGFLAFSEIHPDYYQIPIADREELLAEQAAMQAEAEAREEAEAEAEGETDDRQSPDGAEGQTAEEASDAPATEDAGGTEGNGERQPVTSFETLGGDEQEDEIARRRPLPQRSYKIQEVIKRRQILLVQVVKEERGTKGAALTTYISLAGRYCVLMPNTARGGGVSRKITSLADRKRMKTILKDLEVPQGMGVILRTAGMERSKVEMRRDLDYLLRAWDTVREMTLKSTAPTLVYEEGNIIKRAIRDLYTRDMDEIHIDGEEAYKTAKTFMKLLMPSHAKKVQLYKEPAIPLFQRYQVEGQLDAMHSPVVQLKSGAYIVINSTEALVAIDVNSGRSTRERNIEETAYKTNLEAADEIARQLRLRDLAGLVVIDFIDMEDRRNDRSVERRLKEAMRRDRARIQLGRISPFGLLELSRQRLRPSLMETTTRVCPHCGGTGHVRSTESTAVHVLRAIEEEGIRHRSSELSVAVPSEVALYILNQKRPVLNVIEARYGFRVMVVVDDSLIPPDFRIERVKGLAPPIAAPSAEPPVEQPDLDLEAEEEPDIEAEAEQEPASAPMAEDGNGERKRRRPRRRRKKHGDEATPAPVEAGAERAADEPAVGDGAPSSEGAPGDGAEESGLPRRRRGKRGGRRRGKRLVSGDDATATGIAAAASEPADQPSLPLAEPERGWEVGFAVEVVGEPAASRSVDAEPPKEPIAAQPESLPEPPLPVAAAGTNGEHREETLPEPAMPVQPPEPRDADKPPRRGWWQKLVE